MHNCYCTCFNSDTLNSYIKDWELFFEKENTFAIIDDHGKNVNCTLKNAFLFNEDQIRQNLKFPHVISKQHFWNTIGNRNIVWFYAYLRMLNFYISNPNYDYYWFFDDDVKCSDWNALFSTSKYDSDFLCYFTFKKNNVVSQLNVPIIDEKTYSKQGWFNRFPGDKDTLPENINEFFGSFFPIVRFSNIALKTLLEANKKGYYAYGEGFVPTVLNAKGLALDTLYLPDNTSRHFDINQVKITHKNQTINWEWI
jgi:hypothetical protein